MTGDMPIVTNGVSTNVFEVLPLAFGPMLEVIPTVSEDGQTIQMTIIPSVTEFLGYDGSGKLGPGNSRDASVPLESLPRFRLRQLSASVIVSDGQTIVLGGFSSETVTRHPDESESKVAAPGLDKKQLLVCVTPTIVDHAGNRVHSPKASPQR